MPAEYWNHNVHHHRSRGEVRREARRLLPGCRFRRHLLWRYSVVRDKPA